MHSDSIYENRIASISNTLEMMGEWEAVEKPWMGKGFSKRNLSNPPAA